jgi:MoaA/NifB/PqqE/SkfB family radical SAM enzyme
MSNTFCPIPWNFQAIQNNGTVRVCCQMNMTSGRGTLKKDDDTPYNAGTDNLDEARNASLIKKTRTDMLNGVWPKDCLRCMQEEQAGLRSRRQYENERWNLTLDDARLLTDDDGAIDVETAPVVSYDLRFGNLCNLACRMCGPEDSHTWYKDWAKMYGNEWDDTHGKVVLEKNDKGRWVTDAYDWHFSTTFWDQIESKINNIEHVYMAGGEPLLIERHYEFLEKCIDADVAKNIIIEYNTNVTSIPKKVLPLWSKFKQVLIGASVDGFGDVLEYQRHPAKWAAIEKNLDIIDNLPDNVVAWIACTVTNINVYQIPDFMKLLLEKNYKKINQGTTKILTHHVCHKPWYSSVRVLPLDIKEDIKDHYKHYKSYFDNYDNKTKNRAYKILDSITNYMIAKDESNKLENFVDYTVKLDNIRSQNILDIVPQYKEIFQNDK